ncbi:hypothetical protein H696_02149 [Fonticula alba]|uniref:Importin N-terminal domain-containing protein n=1 Tax=Fonticula alba TaxID=691883 RepID=A0A058ZCN3_FONAL|nr:hypothetical protein H696_02149 [Fonticula alba]KCV71197.1 hypothetical protein H696_02149 [Fonticula alba]|eukprot:XP_009494320.1 hypothetical protein H696_02149 [Fonticula alba]
MDPNTAQTLEDLEKHISLLLENNTETVKNATDYLNKNYLKSPQSVPALCHLMFNSPNPVIRQMSATLLFRQVTRYWIRVPEAERNALKETMLNQIVSDPSEVVRRAMARVVSVIAKHEAASNTWPQLFDFLNQCCMSADVSHRALGQQLFLTCSDTIAETLRKHFPYLFQNVFARGLKDPESLDIRVTTARTISRLSLFLKSSEETMLFQNVASDLLATLAACIAEDDSSNAILVFEAIDEILEQPRPLFASHYMELINSAMSAVINPDLEEDIRHRALTMIMWLSLYKRRALTSTKKIPEIVARIVHILAEREELVRGEIIANDDPDAPDLFSVACETLDAFAAKLSPTVIGPIILDLLTQAFAQGVDAPAMRAATLMALGLISEGCADFLFNNHGAFFGLMVRALEDPVPGVRQLACLGLVRLATTLQDLITVSHAEIIPRLMRIMDVDTTDTAREKVCLCLDAICEIIGDGVLPYLEPLFQRIGALLTTTSRPVQQSLLGIISSLAFAAGERFSPYLDQVISIFRTALSMTAEEDVELRAAGISSLGAVATSVGADLFRPYLAEFLDQVNLVFQDDNPALREASYEFYSCIVRAYRDESASLLEVVVPRMFESVSSEAGIQPVVDDLGEADDLDPDAEGNGEFLHSQFISSAPYLYEKVLAVSALGDMCMHAPAAFAPYIARSVELLVDQAEYFHASVRLAVAVSLGQFIKSSRNLQMGTVPFEENKKKEITPELQDLLNKIVPTVIEMLVADVDPEVSRECISIISEMLRHVGPCLLTEESFSEISTILVMIFSGQLPCQMDDDDDDDEEEDKSHDGGDADMSEFELMILESGADLAGSLALTYPAHFGPVLQKAYPHLIKFGSPKSTDHLRSMVVGCLAEVAEGMIHPHLAPFAESMATGFMSAFSDKEPEVRRNAAYGLGCTYFNAPDSLQAHAQSILISLNKLSHDKSAEVKDHAVGAVARMILATPEAVPLESIVPTILKNHIPLNQVDDEGDVIFNCLTRVLALRPDIINVAQDDALALHLVSNTAAMLSVSDIRTPVIEAGKGFLKAVAEAMGLDKFKQLAATLDAGKQALLGQLLFN